MTKDTTRPILFVDVDGVLSLFGFTPDVRELPGPLHWIDGVAHCIPDDVGPRLARLAPSFELVWATGWEERANEHLPFLLNLPFDELPCLHFDGRAVFGSAHWKLDAIEEYAGERPAAWIDDNLDADCRAWADGAQRPHAARGDAAGGGAHRRARGGAVGVGRGHGDKVGQEVRDT